jgi:hypothetical protein
MFVRGDISILIPDLFRCVVAILTAPAVYLCLLLMLTVYLCLLLLLNVFCCVSCHPFLFLGPMLSLIAILCTVLMNGSRLRSAYGCTSSGGNVSIIRENYASFRKITLRYAHKSTLSCFHLLHIVSLAAASCNLMSLAFTYCTYVVDSLAVAYCIFVSLAVADYILFSLAVTYCNYCCVFYCGFLYPCVSGCHLLCACVSNCPLLHICVSPVACCIFLCFLLSLNVFLSLVVHLLYI